MGKITDNSNELSFHGLSSTNSMLLIPLFQRPYVWGAKQLDRMISEIAAITSEEDNSRFLGAIIAVTRPTNPSQPTPHEIVDGQQRLTTMYLFLVAAAQVAAREGESEYARGLISTNLIVDWAQELPSNTKLQPSIGDRAQFNKIFSKLSKTGDLSDWLPVKLRLPSSAGNETGPLIKQYNRIHKYLLTLSSEKGFVEVSALVETVRNSLTFVFILLKDPGSATTVFEGLNDPGVPISVGDLVKNEVFARIGYDEEAAKTLHDNSWSPFREKFGNRFDDYFFPFAIITKPSVRRTEMFSELRKLWEGLNSKQIIEHLEEYSIPYLALTGEGDAIIAYGHEVGTKINKLIELKCPSSTYPFLMKLLYQLTNNNIAKKDVLECIEVLESFLVRRAVCGIEPTGLLVMFRTMWSMCNNHPTANRMVDVINRRTTIEWPNDARFREAICSRPVYGSGIARYVILELDRSLGGDHPEIDEITLEHIMPRSYTEDWCKSLSKTQHSKIRDLWANLVPLSKPMNTHIGQKPYEVKRTHFMEESMFYSTRQLASKFEVWDEQHIAERSHQIADWAIDNWVKY